MKAKTLHTLRTAAFLPPLALAMSLVLVTGQILNCCRLNESLSTSLGAVIKVMTPAHGHATVTASLPDTNTHPGCHGHGPSTATTAAPLPVDTEGPRWLGEDPCLSELAFIPEGLPSSSPDFSALFGLPSGLPWTEAVRGLAHVGKPRPQNKSSPPVYLLTLRLLV